MQIFWEMMHKCQKPIFQLYGNTALNVLSKHRPNRIAEKPQSQRYGHRAFNGLPYITQGVTSLEGTFDVSPICTAFSNNDNMNCVRYAKTFQVFSFKNYYSATKLSSWSTSLTEVDQHLAETLPHVRRHRQNTWHVVVKKRLLLLQQIINSGFDQFFHTQTASNFPYANSITSLSLCTTITVRPSIYTCHLFTNFHKVDKCATLKGTDIDTTRFHNMRNVTFGL